MKTLRLISVLVFTAAVSLSTLAQTNYYIPGDTIRGNGFTYYCSSELCLRIYNITNTFADTEQLKAGRPLTGDEYFLGIPSPYEDSNNSFLQFHGIINEVLTPSEKNIAKADFLIVESYINSQTGKIMEVAFSFNPDRNGFVRIPPERYHEIETRMKQELVYQINPVGRTYNYNQATWMYRGRDFGAIVNP